MILKFLYVHGNQFYEFRKKFEILVQFIFVLKKKRHVFNY